jgi:uncharacterized membrane protein YozB (DUF420 family)
MNTNWSYLNSFLVQESISLMFVALGLAIIGFGYARLKTKESLQLHRWMLSGAVILSMIAIFFVMFPSLYIYYTTPGVDVFSGFSILQIIHSIVGYPAVMLSVMYLFNDLPQSTRKWMRVAALFWIISIVSGALVYYAMPS